FDSWLASMAFWLEFFVHQIEALREFDIDTQTSVRDLKSVEILLDQGAMDQSGHVRDYIPEGDLVIDIEPEDDNLTALSSQVWRTHIQISEGWIETGPEDFSAAFQDCEVGEFAGGDLVLAEAKRAQFVERLQEWRVEDGDSVFYFHAYGE